jgi:hypothetical protein
VNPQFPIYIVSKGRWESRLTSKALERMRVPYRIVVEASEADNYRAVIDPAKVLVLDPQFQADYDALDAHGMSRSKGSGPARNFAWAHAAAQGAEWHWTVDDNIRGFYRLRDNLKIRVEDGTIFAAMEAFVLRYQNVGMAGPNYAFFAKRKQLIPPFVLNTKIYSCNLIRTGLDVRWSGRYNEDVILTLRLLKSGWCTVQFNAFLSAKMQTQKMKGGNTDEIYRDGTWQKSRMLTAVHPDCARVIERFGRVHHYVDYSRFAHLIPILNPDVVLPDGPDEFGMRLASTGASP